VRSLLAIESRSQDESRNRGAVADRSAKPLAGDNTQVISSGKRERMLGGLLVRRYRWGFSLKTKLSILAVLLVVGLIVIRGIYPFLAVTNRVNADILVVEGWVHLYAIAASAAEFRDHHYRQIFATGGPVVGKGGYVNDYQTSASVGADLLKQAGVPAELVQMVPSHVIGRDRTYSSAVALREWFREHNLQPRAINIVTEGTHARRTRLLFQRALGPNVAVGVISIPSPDFDAQHWWYYSEGVEDVIDEGIGYLYAMTLFRMEETTKLKLRAAK
jgi:uncharacterized SAM-binding protein YcdF (DUF218 family)